MNLTAEKIIDILDLKPLPVEGGYFRETYRTSEYIDRNCLPARYKSKRVFSTVIYYLLTSETFSSLHLMPTDEVFHFYMGDPVDMLQLAEDGSGQVIRIGNDIENGLFPQAIVPKFTWQGTKLSHGGQFALLGCTVSPGFEYEDFVTPDKAKLIKQYPAFSEWIEKLTNNLK